MGSCASVHKDDVGLPKKLLLASSSPPKEGAVDGKGGAPVGDVLDDLKRKIEEQGGYGHSKSPDSGMDGREAKQKKGKDCVKKEAAKGGGGAVVERK